MPSNYFDFVIVGGDLCGLVFAALAAKRGKRVAVVENGEGAQWREWIEHGIPLEVPWLHAVESSPLIKSVLGEIDIFLQVRNRVVRAHPSTQLISADYRLAWDGVDQMEAELRREFPEEADAEMAWVHKLFKLDREFSDLIERKPLLPPDGWGEGRALNKLVAEFDILQEDFPGCPLDRNGVLARYMKAYYPFFTLTTRLPLAAFPFLRLSKGVLDGQYLVEGERPDFRSFFLDVVRRKSGLVVSSAGVSGAQMRRSRVMEIDLRGGKESVGADTVICNMDLKRFLQIIPPESQKKKFHNRVLSRQPAGHLYTLVLVVSGGVFLEGAGAFMLFDPSWVSRPLVVHVPMRQPETRERTVLSATVYLEGAELPVDPDDLDALDEDIIDSIEQMDPFVRERMVQRIRLGYDEAGKVLPARMPPVYPMEEARGLGINDLTLETPYKNVYNASRYLYAGLGLEGAFLGASLLADRLLKK